MVGNLAKDEIDRGMENYMLAGQISDAIITWSKLNPWHVISVATNQQADKSVHGRASALWETIRSNFEKSLAWLYY